MFPSWAGGAGRFFQLCSHPNYRVVHYTDYIKIWLSPRPFINMIWTPENFQRAWDLAKFWCSQYNALMDHPVYISSVLIIKLLFNMASRYFPLFLTQNLDFWHSNLSLLKIACTQCAHARAFLHDWLTGQLLGVSPRLAWPGLGSVSRGDFLSAHVCTCLWN